MVKCIVEPKVIFENTSVLVLDKPAGWIVNEAVTTKSTPVVQTWIKKMYKFETAKSRQYRSGIVHRLDKQTSGVLVVAKTPEAFTGIQKQFKQRKVKKTYSALVHGKVELDRGVINTPVGRLPWNRERFGVVPGGREAETRYKVKSNIFDSRTNRAFSLLELFPKTGRTHQIRIHLKYIGHPIVADGFYAGRKTARKDKEWCPRLFLHASGMEITDPETGRSIKIKSKLPKDLENALEKITKIN